ncbi:MAG: D-alanyl-D-alanine carboxypeptidase [Rhizobiaceae bacterium]|nr:D-alanyl-D-alanine carboxypeptidase [Rhizobiaceae bacterium]
MVAGRAAFRRDRAGVAVRQTFIRAVRRSLLRPLVSAVIAGAVVLGASAGASANAKYAAIVVDANTGKTLFSSAADSARYPASLTKMMTIYMLFDAMAAGKVNKSTRIPISAKASAEPPTKMGLKPGASISVDDAIKALVTKSANDVATAVGEFLGGSEQRFAQMMTNRARSLGMRNTTFRNAHGLPNPGQKTTARDMATLGLALREHHPRYYGYFATRSFTYGKQRIGTHNRVMTRVKGVDGIKTGYIRASGFNVVTSMQDGKRSIVAVVMGGKSARSRDDHMVALLSEYMGKGSTRDRGPQVARGEIQPMAPVAANVASTAAAAIALPKVDVPMPDRRPTDSIAVAALAAPAPAASPFPAPAPRAEQQAALEETGEGDIDLTPTSSIAGWVVQVASAGSEAEARNVLAKVGSQAGPVLAGAMPFTETFDKGGTRFYRARFGGFASKTAARDACAALKKKSVDCYAVQQ